MIGLLQEELVNKIKISLEEEKYTELQIEIITENNAFVDYIQNHDFNLHYCKSCNLLVQLYIYK